jgi:aspartate/methionine/tyrosine aminotransferase
MHSTLLESMDDVVVVEPAHYCWTPMDIPPMFGTNVIGCSCIEEKDWDIDLDALRKSITKKTKFIVLENPCNPTGAVFSERTQKAVADIAGENEVPIIADEIYSMITYDGGKSRSIAEMAGDVPTIVINGMSKFFMRTGWRVGYIAIHDPRQKIAETKRVLKMYCSLYGHTISGMATPILAAATKAYRGSLEGSFEFVKKMQERRDFAFKRLNEIEGVSVVKPKATLYIFPHIKAAEKNWKRDTDFLMDFAKEEGVLHVPGSFFGKVGEFHFRCLLLPEIEVLAEAYDRLERFLKRHKA